MSEEHVFVSGFGLVEIFSGAEGVKKFMESSREIIKRNRKEDGEIDHE